MMTLWPRRGCACQAARRPDSITADMSSSPYGGCFRPTKWQGNRVGGIKEIEPAEPNHASDACIAALRAPSDVASAKSLTCTYRSRLPTLPQGGRAPAECVVRVLNFRYIITQR